MTSDLTCPSTRQLLRSSNNGSGPDVRLLATASSFFESRYFLSPSSYFLAMSKNDMKDRICALSKNDLKDLVKTYCIPLDLHPCLHDPGFTMDRLPADAIGLNKLVSFVVMCRDLNIVPIVTLFRVFQHLCKQGDWFSFSKCRNTEDVCMDDSPSSLKKWKNKFFMIDRKAILDHLTWRHSCSCVSDDLSSDGYDQNDMQRLCARLIRLCEMREEMSIYDFMTLPSWSDAKISEESHHLSLPLLERAMSHSTTLATKGAIIPLPTTDEIVASPPDSPGSSAPELDQAKGTDETDLADSCAKIEDSLERDVGVSMRAVLAPILQLGKRLGALPSIAVVSASEPSHVGTSTHASTSVRSLSLRGVVVSGHVGKSGAEVMQHQMDPLDCLARSALACDVKNDQIPDDDFGTATHGEEIDLTLFPLAPGPYHMPYPYEGVSSPLY
ncbi:hypothetical protein Tco_0688895, partial [Tanacetum coccineum]